MANSIGRFGALLAAVFLLYSEQVSSAGRLKVLPVCFIGRSGAAPPPDPLHGAALSTPRKPVDSTGSRMHPARAQSVAYHVTDGPRCPSTPVLSASACEGLGRSS
uniref:Secreted protein n=1 Tax=Rhipicephalus zambeziensis TaxID=60191 RepID=A0A224YJ25_9ACAR